MKDKIREQLKLPVDYERDPEWRVKTSPKQKKKDPKNPGFGLNREYSYPEDDDSNSR